MTSSSIRIAHLIHGLGLGGAQQVIKFLVQERSPTRFHHHVYSCHGGVFEEPIRQAGGEVRILPRRIPKFDPFWVRSMARAMEKDGIDIVHGHLFGDSFHGYFAARSAGLLPMVLTLHNSVAARTSLQLRGYTWLLEHETIPIACADFVRQSFVDYLEGRDKVDSTQAIRTIPNGIAWQEPPTGAREKARAVFSALGIPEHALILGTVGRMADQKAYHLLLSALADLPSNVRLIMFGDGPKKADLVAQADRLQLGERLVFAGFRDDVPSLLPGLDAVVFSSLYEGLPIALLEAMAAARAVVATRVGGMPEALEDEVSALLIPPDDVPALHQALNRITTDPNLRQRLGAGARSRFEVDFMAQAMVERYETLYSDLAGRAAGGS